MWSSWVDFIPVVGHAKALLHIYQKRNDLAAKAFKRATHSTGVIFFGVLGGHLGDAERSIPISVTGCIVGGLVGGVIVDTSITCVAATPYGYWSQRGLQLFLLVVADGLTGMVAFMTFTTISSLLEDSGYVKEIKCSSGACEDVQIHKDIGYRYLINVPNLLVEDTPQLQETPVDSISQLQPGDHIVYKRGKCWVFNMYDHHAIVGDVFPDKGTYTVYEQAANSDTVEYMERGKAWIKEIEKSFEPTSIFKVDHGKTAKPGDDVMKTAHYICHHATPEDFIKRYDCVRNNCEHFANFCATNLRISHQVQQHMSAAYHIVVILLTIAGFILSTTRKAAECVVYLDLGTSFRLIQYVQAFYERTKM